MFCVEGGKKNKTERNYFKQFIDSKRFNCRFNNDDASDHERLFKFAEMKTQDPNEGIDLAFVVFDLDFDNMEIKKKIEFSKRNTSEKILFIPSNPIFEYWLILHFEKTARGYSTSEEVINDLKKHIPQYKKNLGFSFINEEQVKTALQNAKIYLNQNDGESMNEVLDFVRHHTSTAVPIIFDELEKIADIDPKETDESKKK